MQTNSVQAGNDMNENDAVKRNVLLGVVVGVIVLIIGAVLLSRNVRTSGTNEIVVGGESADMNGGTKQPVVGFEEPMCGFIIPETAGWSVDYNKGGGVSVVSAGREVVIACAEEIPGIPMPENMTTPFVVDGVSGTLYHDASPKDGEAQDDIRVRHKNGHVDVTLRGTPGFVAEVGAALVWSE